MDDAGWVRRPLLGSHSLLGEQKGPAVQSVSALPFNAGPAVIGRYAREGVSPVWVLLAATGAPVWLNGEVVSAGIRVLRDRDEILIAGRARFYFSTEEVAKVEPFPPSAGVAHCARCHQTIQPGTPAVRCPTCGNWCEQSEEKPCWTYGPTCPRCDQATAFETGLRWTPEEL